MSSAAAWVAERFDARRVGPGRWIARCPAHRDRAPSLRISEGRDGRALVHCFAGCRLGDILQHGGLSMRQLYPAGPRPTYAQLEALRCAREQERVQNAAARRRERLRIQRLRSQWEEYNDSVKRAAHLLATTPEDSPGGAALTACFHMMMDELRVIDRELTGENEWL